MNHYNFKIVSASKSKRVTNFIIDLSVIAFIRVLCNYALNLTFDLSQFSFWLLNFLVFIYYYSIMEATTGKTIGKLVTGTRVIRTDGGNLNTDRIVIRSLLRLIPFEGLTFLNKEMDGWHDRFSNTAVVSIKVEESMAEVHHNASADQIPESTFDHFVQRGYEGGYTGGHNNFGELMPESHHTELKEETYSSGYKQGDLYK